MTTQTAILDDGSSIRKRQHEGSRPEGVTHFANAKVKSVTLPLTAFLPPAIA
jgi:hypothetical protein